MLLLHHYFGFTILQTQYQIHPQTSDLINHQINNLSLKNYINTNTQERNGMMD